MSDKGSSIPTVPQLSEGHAIEVNRQGFSISFRRLSERQVAEQSLPLRERIYQRELGWFIKPVNQIGDVRDHFDERSLHLGVVIDGGVLAASARLVHAGTVQELPSGPYLQHGIPIGIGRVCEMSRVLVDRTYRHGGLFKVLLKGCVLAAAQLGADYLFISEAKSERSARYLGRNGFGVIHTDFYFRDGVIEPPNLSTVYGLDLGGDAALECWEALVEEMRTELAQAASRLPRSEDLQSRRD